MANTSNQIAPKKERDVFYFRKRLKNRFFGKIVSFFAEEAEQKGITKKDIAIALNRDPAQISRWLSSPTNMTLDSMSDLLLAMDAEIDGPSIVRFSDRAKRNYAHPLIRAIVVRHGTQGSLKAKNSVEITLAPSKTEAVNAPVSTGDSGDARRNALMIEVL